MIDIEKTIISQYGTSSTIGGLITAMNEWIDPRADIQAFYDYVFNIETAQGFGLDILGRIVNIGRELKVENAPTYFGFDQQAEAQPFGFGTFYNGATTSSVYRLSDDGYRKLILTKALANISATNAQSINRILQNLFAGRGRCYVNDLGLMQFRYTFEFTLTALEKAIITQSGALPRPAGVQGFSLQVPSNYFGFSEQAGAQTFGFGTFLEQDALNAIN